MADAANLIVHGVGVLLEETGADPALSESGHRIALAMIVGLPGWCDGLVGAAIRGRYGRSNGR